MEEMHGIAGAIPAMQSSPETRERNLYSATHALDQTSWQENQNAGKTKLFDKEKRQTS
jgi:hypothetical protein